MIAHCTRARAIYYLCVATETRLNVLIDLAPASLRLTRVLLRCLIPLRDVYLMRHLLLLLHVACCGLRRVVVDSAPPRHHVELANRRSDPHLRHLVEPSTVLGN